jgi:hypothetical protein
MTMSYKVTQRMATMVNITDSIPLLMFLTAHTRHATTHQQPKPFNGIL